MRTKNDFCIILAGGVGRRLWPCSRKAKPKQFLDLFGTGRTLLQTTYDRFARFVPKENIYVSTYREYVDLVHEQLPDMQLENILAEPVQLSTAPAVAWATYHVAQRNMEANMIVSPADQYIVNEERFEEQMSQGLDFVSQHDFFLAMGAKAGEPNTSYGYIQKGEETPQENVFTVQSFTEKPDLDFAKIFVESGEFLWNTGLFLWNVRTMLNHLDNLIPVMKQHMRNSEGPLSNEEELAFVERFYPSNLHLSIDLVILERSRNVFVQACDFGWADIGCWPEVHELSKKDVDGNSLATSSKVMFSASRDNLVSLPKGIAAVIHGLDGYLVAQEGNTLLICPNNDPALVRRLANEAQMQLGEEYM